MNKNESISDRINILIECFAGGKNTRFAELVGTSEANIRNYKNGKMPKIDFIYEVCNKFEINFEWLIAGDGEMRKNTIITANTGTINGQNVTNNAASGHIINMGDSTEYEKIIRENEIEFTREGVLLREAQQKIDLLKVEIESLEREISSKDKTIELLIDALGKKQT